MSERDLCLSAERSEWPTQFVRSIADEPALDNRRACEPVEHLVHRRGESRDLVTSARLRHPRVQVCTFDGGNATADGFDWPQDATR
jgi:hypothetical protein